MHRTARIIVGEHGGEIPSDAETLIKLPGIGPYTAGAVACIAFEKDAAFRRSPTNACTLTIVARR